MKSLTVVLTDSAYTVATEEAKALHLEVPTLCSVLLAEHFTKNQISMQQRSPQGNLSSGVVEHQVRAHPGKFDVAANFAGFPRRSIELAQAIIEEIQKYQIDEIKRVRRGIGVRPNFVFIEYLLSQGGKYGVVVSFYGTPAALGDVNGRLKTSRPTYSRTKGPIQSSEELEAIFQFIRKAHQLKYGS